MGLEGHHEVLASEKDGIKGMKIVDASQRGNALVQERGHHRLINQCSKSLNMSNVIGGIKS